MALKDSIEIPINAGFTGDLSALQKYLDGSVNLVKSAAKEVNSAFGGTVEKKVVIRVERREDGSPKIVAFERERLSVLDQIEQAYKKIEKTQAGSLTSLRGQYREALQARDGISKYRSEIDRTGKSVSFLSEDWVKQNERVSALSRQLNIAGASSFWDKAKAGLGAEGFVSFLNGLTQITQGFQSASIVIGQITAAVNNLLNSLAEIQQFKLSFVAAGAGGAGGSQALAEASRIALNLGTSLRTVRESFQQLTPVVLNSGGTISDVSQITETLSSRFAAYGISGDKARRVTNGVIQAFAKGKLQAEELTQQISEADPAFKTDFARALGVSTAALEDMVKAGQVTSKVLLETLPQLSKSDLLYGKLGTSAKDAATAQENGAVTIDQVRNKIDSLNQLSFERFATGFKPLADAFLQLSAVVSDFFTRVTKLEIIKTIGSIAGGVVSQLANLLDIVLRLAEGLVIAADAVGSLISPLLKIPGVLQAVSLAIVGKLVSPLLSFTKGIKEATAGAVGFVNQLRGVQKAAENGAGIPEIAKGTDGAVASLVRLKARLNDIGVQIEEDERKLAGYKAELLDFNNKLSGEQKSGALTGGTGDPAKVQAYKVKVDELTTSIEKQKAALTSNRTKQEELGATINRLSSSKTKAAASTGLFSSALGKAQNLGKGLIAAIGPLGFLLGAISVGAAAYATVFGESQKIQEETAATIKNLDAVLKDLNGTTAEAEKPITGLALVWEKLALSIASVIDVASQFFSSLGSQASAAVSGPLNDLLNVLKSISIIAAGALLGFVFAGGPAGAAIGGIIGLLITLAASGDDAEVKLRKLEKAANAAAQGAAAQADKISQISDAIVNAGQRTAKFQSELAALQDQLGKAKTNNAPQQEIDKLNEQIIQKQRQITQEAQGSDAAYLALQASTKELVKLEQQYATAVDASRVKKEAFAKGAGASAAAYKQGKAIEMEIEKSQARLNKLAEEGANKSGRKTAAYQAEEAQLNKLKVALQANYKEQSKLLRSQSENDRKKNMAEYEKLNQELYANEKAYKAIGASVQKSEQAIDRAAKSQGFLSIEQKKSAETLGALSEKIKEKNALLETEVTPKDTPEAWRRINEEIGALNAKLQGTKDLSREIQSLAEARTIAFEIDAGRLNDSVSNAKRIVSALEENITVIDIESPDLPARIRELENARMRAEELDGIQASITVNVIGGPEAAQSLNQLQRVVQAINTQKATVDFRSPGFDALAEQSKQAQNFLEAAGKSSSELKRQLATSGLEDTIAQTQKLGKASKEANDTKIKGLEEAKRISSESISEEITGLDKQTRLIQRQSETTSRFYEDKMRALALESAAIQRNADLAIRNIERQQKAADEAFRQQMAYLDKLSPAEQRIQDRNVEKLKKEATTGGSQESRDEAQAQLDAMERDKKKAEAQAKYDEDQKRREEQKARIEEERAEKQRKIQEEQQKLEEERRKKEDEYQARMLEIEERKLVLQEEKAAKEKAAEEEIRKAKEAAAEQEKADAENLTVQQEKLKELAKEEKKEKDEAAAKVLELRENYKVMAESSQLVAEQTKETADQSEAAKAELEIAAKLTAEAASSAGTLASNMGTAAANANAYANALQRAANVQPARATGGPVSSGTTYTVNELGKEGFLSRSGWLRPINKPAHGSWTAPSSGTVIPAHIMNTLQVPATGTRVSRAMPTASGNGGGMRRLLGALQGALAQRSRPDTSTSELATVQAQQAVQIGRLSRAINKLADKNTSVRVDVKPSGSGAGYLNMLNRRM